MLALHTCKHNRVTCPYRNGKEILLVHNTDYVHRSDIFQCVEKIINLNVVSQSDLIFTAKSTIRMCIRSRDVPYSSPSQPGQGEITEDDLHSAWSLCLSLSIYWDELMIGDKNIKERNV